MQQITFYCKRCKKSLRISYTITGNDNSPVLSNIIISCTHCKRAMFLKNYTERELIEKSVDGKYYI